MAKVVTYMHEPYHIKLYLRKRDNSSESMTRWCFKPSEKFHGIKINALFSILIFEQQISLIIHMDILKTDKRQLSFERNVSDIDFKFAIKVLLHQHVL